MRKSGEYYVFGGIRFRPYTGAVEVCETNRQILLSRIQRNFLLVLVERAGSVVTYEELRAEVWPNEKEVTDRVQHTIHVTKRNLIKLLESNGVEVNFIKPVAGQGYLLTAKLSHATEEEVRAEVDDLQGDPTSEGVLPLADQNVSRESSFTMSRLLGKHWAFMTVGSVLYGLLFWIALLLEVAYQFDTYGVTAIWLGCTLAVINAVTSGAALLLALKRLQGRGNGGLLIGLGVLTAAAAGSCWLASLYLPDTPVTLTEFQAQPAFAAFLKNVVVYFLPLHVFFLLIPFYLASAAELKARGVIAALPGDAISIGPRVLMVVCLAAVVYSLISTFFLLDRLRTGVYHGLFVSLIFVRFIVYFGLGFGSLLWYKTTLGQSFMR